MLSIGAFAQVTTDVSTSGLPVTRQEGKARRDGGVSRVFRSIGRAIDTAMGEIEAGSLPRLRNYPY